MASTDAEQASPVRKKNMRQSLGEENSDSIKVVCRFRPYSDSKGKRSQEKISSFNMDTERGVVEFLSEFSDSKQFTFDQVIKRSSYRFICMLQ